MITAAVVLHNVCISIKTPEVDGIITISDDDDNNDDGTRTSIPYIAARRIRDEIAARFQAAR